MANSGENPTLRLISGSLTSKADGSSHQHLFFANWLQTRDNSICPPKEPVRVFHQHNDHSVQDQNPAKLAMDWKRIEKESKRVASADHTSGIDSITLNDQHTRRAKSKIPIRISKMTAFTARNPLSPSLIDIRPKTNNKKSRIPVLINTRQSPSSKQKTTTTTKNSNAFNHFPFDHGANHHSTQQLLTVFVDTTDIENDLMSEETMAMSQLDRTAKSDVEEIKISFSFEKKNSDLSLLPVGCYSIPLSIGQDQIYNDHFVAFKRKQDELKVYYDSFPTIDHATNETSLDIQKAKEFTQSILQNLPSGDVDDRDTLCHVLSKLFGNDDQECLFYNSKDGINLHDASANLADINSIDRPFVLKLNSSEGLGNLTNVKTDQDELELVQILMKAIEGNRSHPVLEDIIRRLSKVHGVHQKSIIIKSVFVGTFNIVYTVLDLTIDAIKSVIKRAERLNHQFKQFISLKIHPLLFRPSFDIGNFDERGNKTFSDENETFELGPPGRTHLYTQPTGWTRFGLKVLNKYPDNTWLDPFQHPGNWYRAFHGTGRAQRNDFGDDSSQSFDGEYASVDALSSIFQGGFRPARNAVYGAGVYCSPNPKFPEAGYVSSVSLETRKGRKTFKCMLQVAVNPDTVNLANDKIWFVPDPKDIRPYGILIKEVCV